MTKIVLWHAGRSSWTAHTVQHRRTNRDHKICGMFSRAKGRQKLVRICASRSSQRSSPGRCYAAHAWVRTGGELQELALVCGAEMGVASEGGAKSQQPRVRDGHRPEIDLTNVTFELKKVFKNDLTLFFVFFFVAHLFTAQLARLPNELSTHVSGQPGGAGEARPSDGAAVRGAQGGAHCGVPEAQAHALGSMAFAWHWDALRAPRR